MRVKLILFVKSLVNYFNSFSLPKMILVNIEIDLMKPLGNFKNEVYTENFKSNLKVSRLKYIRHYILDFHFIYNFSNRYESLIINVLWFFPSVTILSIFP